MGWDGVFEQAEDAFGLYRPLFDQQQPVNPYLGVGKSQWIGTTKNPVWLCFAQTTSWQCKTSHI